MASRGIIQEVSLRVILCFPGQCSQRPSSCGGADAWPRSGYSDERSPDPSQCRMHGSFEGALMSEITPETLLTAGGLVLMTIAVWWGGKAVKGWFWKAHRPAFGRSSEPVQCSRPQRIAHPVTAGDCCAAGFQPGLCQVGGNPGISCRRVTRL